MQTEIVEHLKQKAAQAESDYQSLAGRIAKDETVDPAEAAVILAAVKKTPGDLETEITRLRRIIKVQLQIEELENKLTEEKKVEAVALADVTHAQKQQQAVAQACEDAANRWNNSRYSIQAYGTMLTELRNEIRNLTRKPVATADPGNDFPTIRRDI